MNREDIIELFPNNLKKYIEKCENPQDKQEILTKLFIDKNIKCKLIDLIIYFDYKNVFENINDLKEIDQEENDDIYISEDDLMDKLDKLDTDSCKELKEWILNKIYIFAKLTVQLMKLEMQIKTKDDIDKIFYRSQEAIEIFKSPERKSGYVYTASSTEKLKLYMEKIGHTAHESSKREKSLQTSDPDIKIINKVACKDSQMAENFIHYFFSHLNVNKEFYYIRSTDRADEILNDFTKFVNDMIEKYDKDHEILRHTYVNNENNNNQLLRKTSDDIKQLQLIDNKKIINDYEKNMQEKITEYLNSKQDELTTMETKLLTDDNILKKHCNLRILLRKNIDENNYNIYYKSNKCKKIYICDNLMKVLDINNLNLLNRSLSNNYTTIIQNDWLTDNIKEIFKIFDIRTQKYTIFTYYNIYLLLITVLKNLFDNELFIRYKIKIRRIEYSYYTINENILLEHINIMNNINL